LTKLSFTIQLQFIKLYGMLFQKGTTITEEDINRVFENYDKV